MAGMSELFSGRILRHVVLTELRREEERVTAGALQSALQHQIVTAQSGDFIDHFRLQLLDGFPRHGSRFAPGASVLMA